MMKNTNKNVLGKKRIVHINPEIIESFSKKDELIEINGGIKIPWFGGGSITINVINCTCQINKGTCS